MGVIRASSSKACHLSREYGPVTWYHAPLDLNGKPFRFFWSNDQLRKVIRASVRASPQVNSKYGFKFIQVPNRYWKEPVGYPEPVPWPADWNTSITKSSIWTSHEYINGSSLRRRYGKEIWPAGWSRRSMTLSRRLRAR